MIQMILDLEMRSDTALADLKNYSFFFYSNKFDLKIPSFKHKTKHSHTFFLLISSGLYLY